MNISSFKIRRFLISFVLMIVAVVGAAAQATLERERAFIDASDNRWWYTMMFICTALMVGAYVVWLRSSKRKQLSQFGYENRQKDRPIYTDYDNVGVDAEKELEWFRKTQKPHLKTAVKANDAMFASSGKNRRSRRRLSEMALANADTNDLTASTQAFQDKMKTLQFSQLPIHSFLQLNEPRPFDQLPISSDPAVLCAIEQVNEEFEEDESVRELAVRILAAFRCRNSVEALSQIALYDLSSTLRSKALAILTEFDHESVFETIVLACADPTREVRAAAARGLFRLSFDRADAWKRLIATKDKFRMSHAARAVVESGIAQKSFDRLLHDDMRIAYEAATLVGLLIKAGETDVIFDAIRGHKDERIKLALLHVIKITRDESSLSVLREMWRNNSLAEEISIQVAETLKSAERAIA